MELCAIVNELSEMCRKTGIKMNYMISSKFREPWMTL